MVAQPLMIAFFAVAFIGLASTVDMPLSLASDVGVRDEDACAAVARDGAAAVQRLEASGFPHATDQPREVYRLTRLDKVEAAVAIDWQNVNAYCIPLDEAHPYTVSFDMNPAAYRALVAELSSVITTGDFTENKLANGANILALTAVTKPDGEPDYAYRFQLATWAAGRVVSGSAP